MTKEGEHLAQSDQLALNLPVILSPGTEFQRDLTRITIHINTPHGAGVAEV